MAVTSVILAAGQGTRLGGPKALLWWPAHGPTQPKPGPLAIAHAAARLAAESRRAYIVARPLVADALAMFADDPAIVVLRSREREELGAAGSLAVAARELAALPLAAPVVIAPVDTPPARAATVGALLAALARHPEAQAARPMRGGRGGHPVVLRAGALARYREPDPPPLRDRLRELGAARLDVAVADPDVLKNFNTSDDLPGPCRFVPHGC